MSFDSTSKPPAVSTTSPFTLSTRSGHDVLLVRFYDIRGVANVECSQDLSSFVIGDVLILLAFERRATNASKKAAKIIQHRGVVRAYIRCCWYLSFIVLIALLLFGATQALVDVALHEHIVDERCKHVHKQDGEHHAFGITGD